MTTNEFEDKQARIRDLLEARDLDALLLQRVSSFAWATCGVASHVNTAQTNGESALLITPTDRFVVTNNIEAPRLKDDKVLMTEGWTLRVAPWYDAHSQITDLTRGLRLGADVAHPEAANLWQEVARLRADLTPQEAARFRILGRLCAEAMDDTVKAIRPGQTEHRIAGLLAQEAQNRGVQAIIKLIATDDRVLSLRHPLPTEKRLKRFAMVILCGRRWGLVCSVTRLVHFGPLPDDLRRRAEAVARVDATFIAATRPGIEVCSVFERGMASYAENGYPDEWRHHHQGGVVGYEPREFLATPRSRDRISAGQAYAWNPSIAGAKSEDTILVGQQRNEILTALDGWPRMPLSVDGEQIPRPMILEIT